MICLQEIARKRCVAGQSHAPTVWFTLDVSPIGMVSPMVIETDLNLNVRHPQHDATAVNGLLMTARAYS